MDEKGLTMQHLEKTYDLKRYIDRQEQMYHVALREIRCGKKVCHWMWYIFPQLRGLGKSRKSYVYGIDSLEEAKAYLVHPVLGQRLVECCEALLTHKDKNIEDILGEIDAIKLRSCMTLFDLASEKDGIFQKVLHHFFDGEGDFQTLNRIYNK